MNLRFAAVAIAASLPVGVFADSILLDIPDGDGTDIVWTSGSGAKSSFFDISSQNFNFYEPDYGTPGIVYAWDHDSVTKSIPLAPIRREFSPSLPIVPVSFALAPWRSIFRAI